MTQLSNLRQRLTGGSGGNRHPGRTFWQRLHIDMPLLGGLVLLITLGMIILYSATSQNVGLMDRQIIRMALAFVLMFVCAQIPPARYQLWAPWLFALAIGLLVSVLLIGHVGKGAQRWLNLGFFRFQPSEALKLLLPMMLAWYFQGIELPPRRRQLLVASCIIALPVLLIARQPDLGTALLVASAGLSVMLFAGISWWLVGGIMILAAAGAPVLWYFMHDYQRRRVLTFLNPERDPLGSGYHIIQSKIAIGSGGIYGKGWLNGTQSHLHFLPEHATDFIFAVCGEEFGLLGGIILLAVYLFIIIRCLYIAAQAQDTFSRLLAGGLSLTFFISVFVNMGMVVGILPVVGLPLPLISYGGTATVILLMAFGIMMSIHTHRKLWSS